MGHKEALRGVGLVRQKVQLLAGKICLKLDYNTGDMKIEGQNVQ